MQNTYFKRRKTKIMAKRSNLRIYQRNSQSWTPSAFRRNIGAWFEITIGTKNQIDIGQSTIEEVEASYQFDSLPSFWTFIIQRWMSSKQKKIFMNWQWLTSRKLPNITSLMLKFFDPQAHTSRGISFETVINGYYRATQESEQIGVRSA